MSKAKQYKIIVQVIAVQEELQEDVVEVTAKAVGSFAQTAPTLDFLGEMVGGDLGRLTMTMGDQVVGELIQVLVDEHLDGRDPADPKTVGKADPFIFGGRGQDNLH